MTTTLNERAVQAATDNRIREELIAEQEQTILRSACNATHRYITKSDDEWSIALYAFSKAIDVYSTEKGDFLPFAQMLMKRADRLLPLTEERPARGTGCAAYYGR